MMPRTEKRIDFVPFQGGLQLVTPATRVAAGALLNCVNYEPDIAGGYRRFAGYERFDGRPRPSDAVYSPVACTLTSTPAVGATLTIGAVTCRFLALVSGGMLVVNPSGAIPASTSIFVGVTNVGSTSPSPNLPYSTSPQNEAQTLVDAAAMVRADIQAVPGTGDIRGVVLFNGTLYAWRDNTGVGRMYRATSGGWVQVALAEEITFTNANVNVEEGDVITQGAVTATVMRLQVETGSLTSGTNTGRAVISSRSGGSFSAGIATSSGGGSLTIGGAQTTQQWPAGGKYRFEIHNFFGGAGTRRLYGANGVGRGFEFDGTTVAFIRSGLPDALDKPLFVVAHLNHLMLAIGSSVIASSVGQPFRYVAAEGSAEFGMGDTITGMAALPGEALGVTTRNTTKAIIGSAPDWQQQNVSPDTGAIEGTFAVIGAGYAIDDVGVVGVTPSDRYGNFAYNTVSRLVQPLIDNVRGKIVDSCVVRQRNLYRVFCNDGRVISMYADNERVEFGLLLVPFTPSCSFSERDSSGVERVFVGATNGFVYELDRGSTFDGGAVESAIRVWYTSSRSPRTRKRYYKLAVEMQASLYAQIQVQPDFSYGINEVASSAIQTIDELITFGAGGVWNDTNWDEFFWDAQDVTQPEVSMSGTGINVAMTFYSNTALDFGHVLQGMFIHYSPRRLQR